MKKILALFALIGICSFAVAQSKITKDAVKIPLTPDRWTFQQGKVEFSQEAGMPVMKILPDAGQVVLKDFSFSNGIITFDMIPQDRLFSQFLFRRQDDNEKECFYFRNMRAGNPTIEDAVQYAPFLKGINMWDMYDYYQGPADFSVTEWNHVKLVVSAHQLLVYVNDMKSPVLEVPQLEGNTTQGGFAFNGAASVSNLMVMPNEVEGLPAGPGFDPTHHDPHYLRQWQMSGPLPLPKGRELTNDDLPKPDAGWTPVDAERRGLVNLTRLYGKSESRRLVWLKTTIHADGPETRKIQLGFSDEVWVYINGGLIYVDKNLYTQPIRKNPDGRCTIDNGSFELPLVAGDNELLIGIANDFFGWGIVARLE